MNVTIELDNASSSTSLPAKKEFTHWVNAAHAAGSTRTEPAEKPLCVTIRIVDEDESAKLNSTYRNKPSATNVLSFNNEVPAFAVAELDAVPLGDLAICASVVAKEALEQGKPELAHWAHLVIHGILHLRGFTHESESEALQMETLETEIMQELGYPDPYEQ